MRGAMEWTATAYAPITTAIGHKRSKVLHDTHALAIGEQVGMLNECTTEAVKLVLWEAAVQMLYNTHGPLACGHLPERVGLGRPC